MKESITYIPITYIPILFSNRFILNLGEIESWAVKSIYFLDNCAYISFYGYKESKAFETLFDKISNFDIKLLCADGKIKTTLMFYDVKYNGLDLNKFVLDYSLSPEINNITVKYLFNPKNIKFVNNNE